MGVVIDVGNISGSNLSVAVEKVIQFSQANRKFSTDVKKAVSSSSVFFNTYQLPLVGQLNNTTELPESEPSDVESVDKASTSSEEDVDEQDTQEMNIVSSLQGLPNAFLVTTRT